MAMVAAAAVVPVAGARLPVFEGLRPAPANRSVKFEAPPYGESTYRRLQIFATKRTIKSRQVILSEDVAFLGKAGELVSVKAGYFRNFLYPKAKAKMATPEYLKVLKLEAERKEADKRKLKEEAEAFAKELQRVDVFTVKRKRGMARLIFGTVTSQDLADIIEYRTKKKVDKRNLTVPEIREIGTYTAEVKLHPEVGYHTARVLIRLNRKELGRLSLLDRYGEMKKAEFLEKLHVVNHVELEAS